ncbi:MAG: InlB B-repeat-containing protein [Bacillus subtilis]|nr:InlB B-repeat-containing protein [Bacillus subtilis]
MINSYTITFNSNGGNAVGSITQNYNTAVSAPANPTKTGYTFAGWYSDAGLTSAYTFATMSAENITLYAKWTINSYTITFNSNGGSAIGSITQNYSTAVTQPSDPTKTGYTFAGWYSDAGLTNAYTFTTMPGQNFTLYAKWTINSYTITFNSNGGSVVTSITQNYATGVSAPADPTKTGYTFAGWYSDPGSHLGLHLHHDAGTELHTLCEVDHQLLHDRNFNSNGGSAVGSITQNFATAVTQPADPTKTGYTFAGWYSDAGLTSAYTFATMPGQNTTLYAKWTINSYTITFNSNGGSANRLDHAELRHGSHTAGGSDEDGLHLRRLVLGRGSHLGLHLHHDARQQHRAVCEVDDQQLHDRASTQTADRQSRRSRRITRRRSARRRIRRRRDIRSPAGTRTPVCRTPIRSPRCRRRT